MTNQHQRLERGRKIQRFLRWFTAIGLVCGALYAGIYFGFVYNGQPQEGDCLSSLAEEYDGFQIVSCKDPSAAYEIVNYVKGGKRDYDLHACAEYPTGEVVKGGGGRKSGGRWEFCAVPVGTK